VTTLSTSASESHTQVVAREFFAAALYMALVLLAALVAVPVDRLPGDADLVATMAGTAIGLVLAHWLAFRLAAHLTAEGGFGAASAAREAGAQITGGLAVALVASVPFLVLDGEDALSFTLVLLAALPALTGLAIARLRGRSWVESVITAGIVFGIAVLVVVVKATLGH
jgi:hypothetical protein